MYSQSIIYLPVHVTLKYIQARFNQIVLIRREILSFVVNSFKYEYQSEKNNHLYLDNKYEMIKCVDDGNQIKEDITCTFKIDILAIT